MSRPARRKMTAHEAHRRMSTAYQIHRAGNIPLALQMYAEILNDYPRHSFALAAASLGMRQMWELAKGKPQEFDQAAAMRAMWYAVETATEIVASTPSPSQGVRHDYAAILHNWAKFAQDTGNIEGANGAKAFYEAAVEQDPELGESWTNLGQVYCELGNRMRAEACWNRALECPNITPEARFNLAFLRLMRGDYELGWKEYEQRWESVTFRSSYGRFDLKTPRWDGEKVDRLFIHGEQGAGDIIQMARYLPQCKERCTSLIVEVLEPLVTLFQATFPDYTITARGTVAPEHHAHCPMMSLPMVFGTTLSNVPLPVPFQVNAA